MGPQLAGQVSPSSPRRRDGGVMPDEDKGTDQRQPQRREDPVRQLPPMLGLHRMEIVRADEPP